MIIVGHYVERVLKKGAGKQFLRLVAVLARVNKSKIEKSIIPI